MEKEDPQNQEQETNNVENRNKNRKGQMNRAINVSNNQQKDTSLQAGLGRDRMREIEDLDRISERNAGDIDDLRNENLNAANDK